MSNFGIAPLPQALPALGMNPSDWVAADLCCGMGGLSLAAMLAGCRVVVGVDKSAQALETFRHNFPEALAIEGSVGSRKVLDACETALSASALPTARRLVVSGPPCQGFSAAGARVKRDPRNRVLLAIARAVKFLRADAAIIENVGTLLRRRHQDHLRRLTSSLSEAGYRTCVLELDAAEFGVPQHRRRMLCFVTRVELDAETLRDSLMRFSSRAPTTKEALAGLRQPPVYRGSGAATPALVPNHVAMRHSESVKQKISAIAPGKGPMSYRKLDPSRPSRTLISGNRAPPAHFSEARSITVREAARLQGIPDSFIIRGPFSNQMLHVTNAVPPPLGCAAIRGLLSVLEDDDA